MDICGLWKVREMHLVTPDGEKVFTADSQVDNDMYAEIVQMCKYIMEFAPDGTLNTLLFVPEEVREEAKKQGADIRENGYAVLESTVWKEEDGKFYYDTGIQGEVLGEKVDSFAEISLLPDDCLLYNLGTMILERAETAPCFKTAAKKKIFRLNEPAPPTVRTVGGAGFFAVFLSRFFDKRLLEV